VEEETETLHVMDGAQRVAMVETKTVEGGSAVSTPDSVQRYQLGNHLGTVAAELDEDGEVISYEEYHPYGTTAWQAPELSTVSQKRYRYTGMERDEESGLQCHGVRYFVVWLGRWGSCDPIGVRGGGNTFSYCKGSPISMIDCEGLAPKYTSDHVAGFTAADMLAFEHVSGPVSAETWPVGPVSDIQPQWSRSKSTIQAFVDLSKRGQAPTGVPNLTSMEMALSYSAAGNADRPATLIVPEGEREWLRARSASGAQYRSDLIGTGEAGDPIAPGTGLWVSYETTNDCMGNCEIGLSNAGRPSARGGSRTPGHGAVSETVMQLDPAARPGDGQIRFGMSQMSAGDAAAILNRIDNQLSNGVPVVVGVETGSQNIRGEGGYNEGVTDHFLIIYERGYTATGEVFYSFVDNATSRGERGQYGQFFVNPMEGILFKEPVMPDEKDPAGATYLRPYTVTQAR
jgi:RHS repeat-associated protein